MKRCLIATIAIVLLVGCSSEPRQISGVEFQEYYRLGAGSMHIYEYMGERGGRFYLRHKSMSLLNKGKWDEEILYTEDRVLNPILLEELKKQAKEFVEQ